MAPWVPFEPQAGTQATRCCRGFAEDLRAHDRPRSPRRDRSRTACSQLKGGSLTCTCVTLSDSLATTPGRAPLCTPLPAPLCPGARGAASPQSPGRPSSMPAPAFPRTRQADRPVGERVPPAWQRCHTSCHTTSPSGPALLTRLLGSEPNSPDGELACGERPGSAPACVPRMLLELGGLWTARTLPVPPVTRGRVRSRRPRSHCAPGGAPGFPCHDARRRPGGRLRAAPSQPDPRLLLLLLRAVHGARPPTQTQAGGRESPSTHSRSSLLGQGSRWYQHYF